MRRNIVIIFRHFYTELFFLSRFISSKNAQIGVSVLAFIQFIPDKRKPIRTQCQPYQDAFFLYVLTTTFRFFSSVR